jgi:hypothetical protein
MKPYVIAVALLLSACATNNETGLAPAVQIPPLPENLAQKAKALAPSNNLTMGGQVLDNAHNIREYNKVSTQLNHIIDVYNCMRESINNKKEPKCL